MASDPLSGVAHQPTTKSVQFDKDDLLIGNTHNDSLVGNYRNDELLGSDRLSKNSKVFSGTYLTTPTPNSPLRSIITFTKDHNIFIIDSIQGGISGKVNPFSETHGTWKSTGENKIAATVLNFSYPTTDSAGTVSRGDIQARFSPRGQTVKGTIKVRLFDIQQDPLTSSIPASATYTFTGQRLTALGA